LHNEPLRGRPLLAHGATCVATVAGKLDGVFCIFTILATVFCALSNPAIACWVFTFHCLFAHANSSIHADSHLAFQAHRIFRTSTGVLLVDYPAAFDESHGHPPALHRQWINRQADPESSWCMSCQPTVRKPSPTQPRWFRIPRFQLLATLSSLPENSFSMAITGFNSDLTFWPLLRRSRLAWVEQLKH